MKRFALLITLALALTACEKNPYYKAPATMVLERPLTASNRTLEIVLLDGCEYLYGDWANATVLTHKGNCKYCAARNPYIVSAK